MHRVTCIVDAVYPYEISGEMLDALASSIVQHLKAYGMSGVDVKWTENVVVEQKEAKR